MDKPAGFTSFDVVAKLRGMLKTKRLGHAGTLDPMATGVLPVFVGAATRACDCMSDDHKRYTAAMQLGLVTDTQDTTGSVLSTAPFAADESAVQAACTAFVGELRQVPPMYSAVKIDGRKLVDLARRGVEIDRPARPVTIYRLQILAADYAAGRITLDVTCSKGTYIRTLCHDIGAALGCGAALCALRRTEAAGFTIGQAVTFERLRDLLDNGQPLPLSPTDAVFAGYPAVRLDARCAALFSNGVRLRPEQFSAAGSDAAAPYLRVYRDDGRFLGLGRVEEGHLHVKKNFPPAL